MILKNNETNWTIEISEDNRMAQKRFCFITKNAKKIVMNRSLYFEELAEMMIKDFISEGWEKI